MNPNQPPPDPKATVKMIPAAMFETREFSQEEIAERLAQRPSEPESPQASEIQPPPSTSSSR